MGGWGCQKTQPSTTSWASFIHWRARRGSRWWLMSRIDRSNSARYWNSARVPDLSSMAVDFPTRVYTPHSHGALVVAVTEWGGSEVSTRGAVEHARSSAVLVFNPGEPHWGRMAGWKRWRYRAFYLGRAGMDALA